MFLLNVLREVFHLGLDFDRSDQVLVNSWIYEKLLKRTTWECCDVDASSCSEYDLINEGNLIYDAYYQQMVVSGPDYGACNFSGSAKIVSDCIAMPGSG